MAHDLSKLPEVTKDHFDLIESLIGTTLTPKELGMLKEIRNIVSYTYGAQIATKMMEKHNAPK